MKQFTYNSLHPSGVYHHGGYVFECAMISTCKPVFDGCADNYDVEQVLRKAKVLLPTNLSDTESCALLILFRSEREGQRFIRALNKYIKSKTPDVPAGRKR